MVAVNPEVPEAVTAALRGPYRLAMTYQGSRRLVEPYGVLLGARRYLVARQPDKDAALRHFRLRPHLAPEVTGEWFARDAGFTFRRTPPAPSVSISVGFSHCWRLEPARDGLGRWPSALSPTIHRIWQASGLRRHRSEAFKLSSDPLFVEGMRDTAQN